MFSNDPSSSTLSASNSLSDDNQHYKNNNSSSDYWAQKQNDPNHKIPTILRPLENHKPIQSVFLNCQKSGNKQTSGRNSHGLYSSSGYWMPSYNTPTTANEMCVQNIKQRLKSSANNRQLSSSISPSNRTPVDLKPQNDLLRNHVNARVNEINRSNNHEPIKYSHVRSSSSENHPSDHERASPRDRQNYNEIQTNYVPWNHLFNKLPEETGEVVCERSQDKNCDANAHPCSNYHDCYEHSTSKQYVRHLRQTSADIFSKKTSPFQNLNYCRITNLSRVKVTCDDNNVIDKEETRGMDDFKLKNYKYDEISSPLLQYKVGSQTMDIIDGVKMKKEKFKTTNGILEMNLQDNPSSTLDSKPPSGTLKIPSTNNNSDQFNTRPSSSFLELPQLKTKSGSLGENIRNQKPLSEGELTRRMEDGRCRVRGLSLSVSCLPFKPFLLQKPNLPWNRISPVSSCRTSTDDFVDSDDKFSNYVRLNIFPGREKLSSRAKESREDCARHSLPALWNTELLTSSNKIGDTFKNDNFSTSSESVNKDEMLISEDCQSPPPPGGPHSNVNTLCSNVTKKKPLFLESHFPYVPIATKCSSPRKKKLSTLLNENSCQNDEGSHDPPTPPHNRPLYQNVETIKFANKFTNNNKVSRCKKQFSDSKHSTEETPTGVTNSKTPSSCQKEVRSADQQNWLPYRETTTEKQSLTFCGHPRSNDSQEYVAAVIRHQKQQICQNKPSDHCYPTAAVKPQFYELKAENNCVECFIEQSRNATEGDQRNRSNVGELGSLSLGLLKSNPQGICNSKNFSQKPDESYSGSILKNHERMPNLFTNNSPDYENITPTRRILNETSLNDVTSSNNSLNSTSSPGDNTSEGEISHETTHIDQKLKDFLAPHFFLNSTPRDRLLISILDLQSAPLPTDTTENTDSYKKLFHLSNSEHSPTSLSPSGDAISPTSSFSSLDTSLDTSSSDSANRNSLPQSPSTGLNFIKPKFPTFSEEQDDMCNESGDNAEPTYSILNNYKDLEARVAKSILSNTDRRTWEKFCSYLEQLDTVLHLIIKLADQLAKISSETRMQKDHLTAKQNRLIEKLVEARDLKANIDKKGELLALKIKKNVDKKSFDLLEFLLKTRTYIALLNKSTFVGNHKNTSFCYNEVSSN